MNGTSIFGCLFASVSALTTGNFYQMGRSNVRRRHRNLLDYPDSHNLWNTQILTRIWPFLTRLPDDSLLLLQPSFINYRLNLVLPSSSASFCLSQGIISRLSFSVFSEVDVIKISSSSENEKIWKSILHKSLIHSKIRRFFFFCQFLVSMIFWHFRV